MEGEFLSIIGTKLSLENTVIPLTLSYAKNKQMNNNKILTITPIVNLFQKWDDQKDHLEDVVTPNQSIISILGSYLKMMKIVCCIRSHAAFVQIKQAEI